MTILIAVASKHGSTCEIAQVIADELRTAHLAVDLQEASVVEDIAGYDAVILGSAVYMGRWLPDAHSFAERHHAALATLPVWVFSSGPLGTHVPQPHDDPQRLAAPLGKIAVRDHQVFVGKLDKHQLGWGEWLVANAVKAPEGDGRDWAAIRSWAQTIASAVRTSDPSGA